MIGDTGSVNWWNRDASPGCIKKKPGSNEPGFKVLAT
jgi:hypothetical protein